MANRLPALAIGFAALGAVMQPSAAHAATSEDELWLKAGVKGDIAPGTDLKLEVETRHRAGPNENIIAAEINTDVSGAIALGGGMEIHDEGGFTEVRPYQQLTFGLGKFDFRSRIEERFYDNADRMALRLRQRVLFRTPIADKVTAFTSGELFYQLRDRNEGGPQRIDQWRFNAGLTARIAPKLELSGGYLFRTRPRSGGNTRHTHVTQVSLYYRF